MELVCWKILLYLIRLQNSRNAKMLRLRPKSPRRTRRRRLSHQSPTLFRGFSTRCQLLGRVNTCWTGNYGAALPLSNKKLTWNTKSWRWVEVDLPLQMGDFRFQPLIFQGVSLNNCTQRCPKACALLVTGPWTFPIPTPRQGKEGATFGGMGW